MFITVIAAFCFAYYFVNTLQGAMLIKRVLRLDPKKRLKPFDCVQCLAVWSAVALYLLPYNVSAFFAVVFLTGFISIKIK